MGRRFLVNNVMVGADDTALRVPCLGGSGTMDTDYRTRTKGLAALELPVDAPGTIEELACLHEQLSRTLSQVEARHAEATAALQLTSQTPRDDLVAVRAQLMGAIQQVDDLLGSQP